MPEQNLNSFAEGLLQDTLGEAELQGGEQPLADAFSGIALEMLAESGEVEDPMVCYARPPGMEISAYGAEDDEGRLDVFACLFDSSPTIKTLTRDRVKVALQRLRVFVERCLAGYFRELEESSPVFDMALHIHDMRDSILSLRLFVVTNQRVVARNLSVEALGAIPATLHIWDIERLHRLATSGAERQLIIVDFEKLGHALPCLPAPGDQEGYRAFLALVPGDALREIYRIYGARLLERNVRSFLQARGKVNRGIRDTILTEPVRFLAYNNGITMTAESIELDATESHVKVMHGLQIVNGGQTTASLLSTGAGKADLSSVSVAAKIIEIGNGEEHDGLIRNVSRYANTQNRITEADFAANDKFHVKVEELSRTIWAPALPGTQRETRWFYERARGQYQDAKASALTLARRRLFQEIHPNSQKFTKTDLAKFENTWEQLPHIVSRGAQKNFSDFMIRLGERTASEPDGTYFQRLIGKAILFRHTEKLVGRQDFGGYRANIVTYSLAWLSNETSQRIDLERIWREQALTPALSKAIVLTSHQVHGLITNPPEGRNVTEWCKNERCWDSVRKGVTADCVEPVNAELVSLARDRSTAHAAIAEMDQAYVANVERIIQYDADAWRALAQWGTQTGSLRLDERRVAQEIARWTRTGMSRPLRADRAAVAIEIIERAAAVGFDPMATG